MSRVRDWVKATDKIRFKHCNRCSIGTETMIITRAKAIVWVMVTVRAIVNLKLVIRIRIMARISTML